MRKKENPDEDDDPFDLSTAEGLRAWRAAIDALRADLLAKMSPAERAAEADKKWAWATEPLYCEDEWERWVDPWIDAALEYVVRVWWPLKPGRRMPLPELLAVRFAKAYMDEREHWEGTVPYVDRSRLVAIVGIRVENCLEGLG